MVKATRWETRGVLAGAYRGKDIEARTLRTHLVAIDAEGYELRVVCGLPVDHVADPYAHTEAERTERPTCPRCGVRFDRLV